MKYIYLNNTKILIPEFEKVPNETQYFKALDDSQSVVGFALTLRDYDRVYFENGNYTIARVYDSFIRFTGVYTPLGSTILSNSYTLTLCTVPYGRPLSETKSSFGFCSEFFESDMILRSDIRLADGSGESRLTAGYTYKFAEGGPYPIVRYSNIVPVYAKAAFGEVYQYIHTEISSYTATFVGGDGSTGNPPDPVSGPIDPETGKATITIPSGSGTLAKQGLFFDGWEFNGPIGTVVLHAGEVIQISSDVTLTAHWILINPEYPGTPSEPSGGGGSLVIESDDIDLPELPGSSIGLDAGVLAMFNPDIADLSNLEGYLMQTSVASALRNIFQDPMNCVVSLKAVPFTPNTTADKKEWIVAAGLGLGSTGVYMKAITNQYVEFDFGDITVDEIWGNALDYAPNTEIQIYMPYIGVRSIDTDDIMGGTINLTYHTDLLSGIISAFLSVTRDGHSNVIYTWTGSCGIQLPLTGADSASIIRNAISLAGMVTTGIASGGASTVAGAAQLGANAVGQATGGMKVPIQRGGQISGDAGNLGSQTPYLIFNRPHQSIPEGFGRQFGYTCNISGPLSQFRGMTVVRATHMEGFPATDEEVKEIEALLKKGVIL